MAGFLFGFIFVVFGYYATGYAITGESGRPVPTWVKVFGALSFFVTIPVAFVRWTLERPERMIALRIAIMTALTVSGVLAMRGCVQKVTGVFD